MVLTQMRCSETVEKRPVLVENPGTGEIGPRQHRRDHHRKGQLVQQSATCVTVCLSCPAAKEPGRHLAGHLQTARQILGGEPSPSCSQQPNPGCAINHRFSSVKSSAITLLTWRKRSAVPAIGNPLEVADAETVFLRYFPLQHPVGLFALQGIVDKFKELARLLILLQFQ